MNSISRAELIKEIEEVDSKIKKLQVKAQHYLDVQVVFITI